MEVKDDLFKKYFKFVSYAQSIKSENCLISYIIKFYSLNLIYNIFKDKPKIYFNETQLLQYKRLMFELKDFNLIECKKTRSEYAEFLVDLFLDTKNKYQNDNLTNIEQEFLKIIELIDILNIWGNIPRQWINLCNKNLLSKLLQIHYHINKEQSITRRK